MIKRKPILGLALGSGSARGWAQLGLMDCQRGPEAIPEGHAEVKRMWPAILHALES